PPAPEADEDRPDRTGYGGQAAQHLDDRLTDLQARDEHRDDALQEVPDDHHGRPPPAQRTEGVRTARPARADRPRVDAAGVLGDEDADRDRPAHIGSRDEGEI